MVDDQFTEMRKQLDFQLTRTGDLQRQMDIQRRDIGELRQQLGDVHSLLKDGLSRPAQISVLVYFLYLMDFEFDAAKSAANLTKHGIDFVGAQALWSNLDRLEIPARSLDEPRTQVIGRIGDVVWSAFITMRDDRVQIISVRRARDEEKAAYLKD